MHGPEAARIMREELGYRGAIIGMHRQYVCMCILVTVTVTIER